MSVIQQTLIFPILALIGLVGAQIAYDPVTNSLSCSHLKGSYCMVDSLGGPGVVSCVSSTVIEVRSCNIELSHILPKGYEETAVCYQSSEKAGDAHCAFNGTGYSLEYHSTVPVPGTVLCESVQPPVAQKKAIYPVTRFSEDSLDNLWDNMVKLNHRSLPSGSPKPIVSAAPDSTQESPTCSNPWPEPSTVSSQEPSPIMQSPSPFIPAITTINTPSVQHFQTSQSTSIDTDTTEATATLPSTPSPVFTPWDVLTVTPATSTTTVTSTSTSCSSIPPVSTTLTSQAWRFSWTGRDAPVSNATLLVTYGLVLLRTLGLLLLL